MWESKVRRHDQVMVGKVQKMGKKANGPSAKIQLRKIPAEFASVDYFEIVGCDGDELVVIQYDGFKVDSVISILNYQGLNKWDKFARIAAEVNR